VHEILKTQGIVAAEIERAIPTFVPSRCELPPRALAAWDYLEATGELGNPDIAAGHLLDTIETMIRHGERRRLLLSNTVIASYQRFRAEQALSLAS
jgi:hypothetical protein